MNKWKLKTGQVKVKKGKVKVQVNSERWKVKMWKNVEMKVKVGKGQVAEGGIEK